MTFARPLAALAFVAACASGWAADRACTKADASAAEKSIDKVLTWPALSKAWRDYRHCDEGPVADQFTEALLRLMVGNWKTVEGLSNLMKGDAEFREFVVAHLKSPAAASDVDDVYSLAKASCPKGQEAFCIEIAAVVKAPPAAPAMAPMEPIRPSPSTPSEPAKAK